MDRFDALEKELDALRDRAVDIATEIVTGKLRDLESRYPRHKFGLVDGMGTTFFTVSPPFLGEEHMSHLSFFNAHIPEAGEIIVNDLFEQLNDILSVVEHLDQIFGVTLGDIKSPGG